MTKYPVKILRQRNNITKLLPQFQVKFGKTTQRATSPEETNFFLLHLSLLREYLEQEFISIKDNLPFKYDIEKVVDDWVLMGFLVGNDFIPNLPNMHISNDALPILYSTYMKVLPMLDGEFCNF